MAKDSDSTPPKRKVLDLIEPAKAPSRRERQRSAAAPAKPEVPVTSALDTAKANALDIFDDSGKKKRSGVRKTEQSGKPVLPVISKLLDDEEPAAPAVDLTPPPAPIPVSEPVASVEDSAGEQGENYISIKPPIIVSELAARMGLKPFVLLADLIKLQVFVAPNQAIEPDIAAKVCELHGFFFEREKREKGGGVHKVEEVIVEPEAPQDEPEDVLQLRPPIITIMGHVDHGKTSLLDYIRKSSITKGEAGGITQHVAAYKVEHEGKPITFIDTPGHAIFSDMRARGADITDIVVLVVAANDGIMPQTLEAIEHAKKAKKTVIVAINKCDLPAANVMRVKTQLAEKGLQTVDFGGDVECVEISALTGSGIPDLLELLALQAEVLELKANPKGNARAAIIEARVQPGRGATASAIVETGTLKVGTPFICGPFAGRVKSLINDRGESVKEAKPGTPVEVVGFEEMPHVGDELVEMDSVRAAQKLADERQLERRADRLKMPQKSRMEDLFSNVIAGTEKAVLKLVLKCDVQGSVEAIRKAIGDIQSDKVNTQIIIAGAGPITEGDVQMASSADAIILGFNVKVEANAVKVVKSEGVQVKLYSIVYELIDQVREAMLGLLEPLTREKIIGHAEVKMIFKLSKSKGRAAGCYVKDGKVHRKAHARVLRGGVPVFDGKMSTLRRFQDEVEEVKSGVECGIRLGEFNEYQEGDVIECYTLEKIPQSL
ncbi:MAG: translation initiation factor IF-2 [Verrucomicrobia bacterium]|nr:MAG: translation initiation factor IF-2 [Verrucomicrobiota bacterium]TAE87886.1 MAG: translation initiation factor IF-2 [Verrucomicrobiota bacterium]TAF25629.1 MAG: translation initiation factor IF-2 [Verrucomicrobiota bacterium]TAF41305.1 MAG: translation initiation factor IF-2 [Verrucomicrobiota bacterium]